MAKYLSYYMEQIIWAQPFGDFSPSLQDEGLCDGRSTHFMFKVSHENKIKCWGPNIPFKDMLLVISLLLFKSHALKVLPLPQSISGDGI